MYFLNFTIFNVSCTAIHFCRIMFYTAQVNRQGAFNMDKYVCLVCGYVYDPAENNNVAFEDLPADWICPVCAVGKDQFVKQ